LFSDAVVEKWVMMVKFLHAAFTNFAVVADDVHKSLAFFTKLQFFVFTFVGWVLEPRICGIH